MKAVFIDSPGKVRVEDVPKPIPAEGEVLVRLRCCGICGTDLEKVHGQGITSKVLGHEEVGEVALTGPGVKGLIVGDRVFAHHHVPCGDCDLCRKGEETQCAEYAKYNLVPCGLAEYFIVPRYNVERSAILKLPDSLGYEEASFIEPLACCIRGLERAGAQGVKSVLIYGAGPVGLLQLKLLKSYTLKPTVVISDISDYRLKLASQMGADATFNVAEPSQKEMALARVSPGPELIILATGSSAAFEDAMKTVAKGGTVLLFGAPKKGGTASLDLEHFFLNGTRLVTSYSATEKETTEAMNILATKRLAIADMITHRFPLSQAADAFDVADKQQCMKALVTA
jgi:L-iditol 2-dehydrogenase